MNNRNRDRWQKWEIRVPRSEFEQFKAALIRNLPPTWRLEKESPGPTAEQPSALKRLTFATQPTGFAYDMLVKIDWYPSTGSLYGSSISWSDNGTEQGFAVADSTAINLLTSAIIPTAVSLGLKVYDPTEEEVFFESWPSSVPQLLKELHTDANRKFPLTREQRRVWQKIVLATTPNESRIDESKFVEWLSSQGWNEQEAQSLSQNLFDECEMLERYREELLAR